LKTLILFEDHHEIEHNILYLQSSLLTTPHESYKYTKNSLSMTFIYEYRRIEAFKPISRISSSKSTSIINNKHLAS
jgi:hypothetical protein